MPENRWPIVIARPLAACLLVLSLTGTAAAQDPLGRPAVADTLGLDVMLDRMQTQLELLLPAMQRMVLTVQSLPELEAEGMAAPDVAAVARRAARFTRAYFDALVAEGFSHDDALRIVSGVGPPGRP